MNKFYLFIFLLLSSFGIFGQCSGDASLNPSILPINNSYEPGETINFCYNLSDFLQNDANWLEGFVINFDEGWENLQITQPPNNVSSSGEWVWLSENITLVGPVGPGFFYDRDNDGDPTNDYGDSGLEDRNFCFNLTVAEECDLDLSITISYAFDGLWGSYNSSDCDEVYTDSFFNGVTSGGNVNTGDITHNLNPCPDTVCTGLEVSYSVTGNQSSIYDWNITGGGLVTPGQTNDCDIVWGDIPGTYTISVQEITEAGCEGVIKTCDVEVVVPDIIFDTTKYSMCLNSSVELVAQPLGGDWSSEYMNGNTFVGTKPGTYHPSYLTNIYGCDIQEEVEVVVKRKYEAPNIIYSSEVIDLCQYPALQTYIAEDSIGYTYSWFIDDVKQGSTQNYIEIEWPDTTRTYIVKVIAYDEIGCESEPKLVSVRIETCQRFFAPNSFTPNGDGINDVFIISGLSVYQPNLKIFNRWGVEVYVSSNLYWTGDGGNGYYCDNGVYNWIIEYKDKLGQNRQESGHVTLIR